MKPLPGMSLLSIIRSKMKYCRSTTRKGNWFEATIEHRHSRRGKQFWIIMYTSKSTERQGYIHLPDDWQDADRTYTAQDIYWEDKYDCQIGQREAA